MAVQSHVMQLFISNSTFGIYRLQSAEDDFTRIGGQLRAPMSAQPWLWECLSSVARGVS